MKCDCRISIAVFDITVALLIFVDKLAGIRTAFSLLGSVSVKHVIKLFLAADPEVPSSIPCPASFSE
jgi:hypothetical protein